MADAENTLNGTVGVNYEINENHYIGLRYDLKLHLKNTKDIYLTSDIYADGGELYQMEKSRTKTYGKQAGISGKFLLQVS